jgi:hypothetical protein
MSRLRGITARQSPTACIGEHGKLDDADGDSTLDGRDAEAGNRACAVERMLALSGTSGDVA